MAKTRAATVGMFGLGVGYFAWYVPYSGLAKALSSGLVPGIPHAIGGLVLLPAAASGTLLGMPILLTASRWWRYSAVLSLLAYMMGYVCRFQVMDRHAKSGDQVKDGRYFVEEHMTSSAVFPALLIGSRQSMGAYRACAGRLRDLVRDPLAECQARYALSGVEGA